MSDSPEQRALDELIARVRREPGPDLDWERIERAIERAEARPRARRGWDSRVWVGGAAMLAAAAGVAFALWPQPVPDGGGGAPSTAQQHEAAPAFAVGTTYAASGAPLTVSLGALGNVTLAAGAKARVVDTGRYATMELERGTITANITPELAPESFAIHAGRVRVATKGTVFSVERGAVDAVVVVERGTVVVGPTDSPGSTEGRELTAPERGVFALDASSFGAPPPAPEATEDVNDSAPPRANPAPAQPAAAQITKAAAQIEASVEQCFAQHTKTTGGITVRADTLMKIRFAPSGSVDLLSFDPPLAPRVQTCASTAASAVKVPRSRDGATTSKRISL